MRDDVTASDAFRQEVRDMVQSLLDDLPPESRRFAGQDEAALDAFVDEIIRDGSDDLMARLSAAADEAPDAAQTARPHPLRQVHRSCDRFRSGCCRSPTCTSFTD